MAIDLRTAKSAAKTVMDHIRVGESMAQPGTYEYYQFMGATLMRELARIRFICEMLEKE